MNVQTKKLELIQLILNTDKPAILDRVSQLLKQEIEPDWWDEIPDAIKESIDVALGQAERGETISHKEVVKEARAKYGI